jgi:hypothetical protein
MNENDHKLLLCDLLQSQSISKESAGLGHPWPPKCGEVTGFCCVSPDPSTPNGASVITDHFLNPRSLFTLKELSIVIHVFDPCNHETSCKGTHTAFSSRPKHEDVALSGAWLGSCRFSGNNGRN